MTAAVLEWSGRMASCLPRMLVLAIMIIATGAVRMPGRIVVAWDLVAIDKAAAPAKVLWVTVSMKAIAIACNLWNSSSETCFYSGPPSAYGRGWNFVALEKRSLESRQR